MSSRRFAQRGKRNLDRIEPEQQILSKPSGRHLGIHVGVGGRYQTHVHAPCPRGAQPLEFAGGDDPQKLRLLGKRNVGDLIEKECAAVSQLEPSRAIGPGVGERAPHVPEQLALEHAFGHAASIDGHHGT